MSATDFMNKSALLGLNQRQQRLLELDALYEGTQYESLLPWEYSTNADTLRYIPIRKRKPGVQLGLARDKADRLRDKLVGEGRLCQIDLVPLAEDGSDLEVEETPDALEYVLDVLHDQLELEDQIGEPVKNLLVKGSFVLGFARTAPKQWEPVLLDPTWCEVIFVAQVGTPRAQQIAAELTKQGIDVRSLGPAMRPGAYLPCHENARSHEVAFLRYQYRYHQELTEQEGGSAARDETWWKRRDYTANAIIDWDDVKVSASQPVPQGWEISTPPDPHNWGVPPVVWERAKGAAPGEMDGPSLFTPEFQSVCEAADYAESLKHGAVAINTSPMLHLNDLRIAGSEAETLAHLEIGADEAELGAIPSDPGSTLLTRTVGGKDAKPMAQFLEIDGSAIDRAEKHVESLKVEAGRMTGIYDTDQRKAEGVMSGTAIERDQEPTIARVKHFRKTITKGLQRYVQRLAIALAVDREVEAMPFRTDCLWPKVVPPTPADLQATAVALTTANGGQPVVSQETSVRLFANAAELPNEADELAKVQKDEEEAMAQARQQMEDAMRAEGGQGKRGEGAAA